MTNATQAPSAEQQVRERLDRQAVRLTEATGIKWTVGYIGNVGRAGDDRSWFLFAEHEGRVGTRDDSIGGVRTVDLELLASLAAGAVALARVLQSRGAIVEGSR
jgi:hypothetical protein